jgi:hypothetical protein
MAQRKYAAFAGVHTVDTGRRRYIFKVAWLGKDDAAPLNENRPPGHADRVKTGWYWFGFSAVKAPRIQIGPFSSSRKAYQDARLYCRAEPKEKPP